MDLDFNAEGIEMPALDKRVIGTWLQKVAESHGRVAGRLTYIFMDDKGILDVNRTYLNHDYYTDIITFDYSKRRMINGDMYISLDTVRSNAELVGVEYINELYRVIVHGVLHLCGINDKGPGEREIMEHHEDTALTLLQELFKTTAP